MRLNKSEIGRSTVEILGVLAIIGVLSVGGIVAYIVAMNKHRANTLLEEANRRATIVAEQIAFINKTPSLNEFDNNNNFGYAIFDSKIYGEDKTSLWTKTDRKFSLQIKKVSKPVCQNLQNTASDIIQDFAPSVCEDDTIVILTYNNNLSTESLPDIENNPPQMCSEKNSQCCDPNTGDTASYENEVCNFNEGENNGICLDGQCVENNTDKPCNVNYYADNTYCGGIGSGFYCYYSTGKCRAISAEERDTGKLQTDFSRPGRGTDWYTAMNFCSALGKKLPSLSDLAIALPAKKQECYLPDYPDSKPLVPDACITSTTLKSLQERFNETTHALYVSNSDGSYSYIVDLGGTYPGYVYRNHKTSAQGMAICE